MRFCKLEVSNLSQHHIEESSANKINFEKLFDNLVSYRNDDILDQDFQIDQYFVLLRSYSVPHEFVCICVSCNLSGPSYPSLSLNGCTNDHFDTLCLEEEPRIIKGKIRHNTTLKKIAKSLEPCKKIYRIFRDTSRIFHSALTIGHIC
jgi:hypothetical protein